MELHVITGAGDRLRTGGQTHKGVTMCDLTGLLVGSEGTLAVTTRAALKLRPAAIGHATILATFPSPLSAAAAALEIVLAGLDTAALDLIDDQTIEAILLVEGKQLVDMGLSVLLLQFEGSSATEEARRAERVLQPLSVGIESTFDEARGNELFAARRLAIPSILAGGAGLIEDIVVPIPAIPAAMNRIREVEAEVGLPIAVIAHAADGNLHPIISVAGRDRWLGEGDVPAAATFPLGITSLGGSRSGNRGSPAERCGAEGQDSRRRNRRTPCGGQ
jgi:glycolate oxidase